MTDTASVPIPAKSDDDLLTVKEIAREYRIGRDHVWSLVHSGELRHLRVGIRVLIPRWVVLEWIRDNLSGDPKPLMRD